MFFNQYPYLNLNDFNLDYILKTLRALSERLENFIALNTIKYANPIQWNITKQYEANTVVIDANDGTAYLSVKPVPTGVAITNTDYWTPIFTLNLLSANQNITLRDDGSNVLATFASSVDDWLIWNNTLYKVSQAIAVNEAYVVGYNLTRYSVELFLSDAVNAINAAIGELNDLDTTAKDNIVNAINEVNAKIDNYHVTSNFPTVSDMIADSNLAVTDVVSVAGYYAENDGGASMYIISDTPSGFYQTLASGKYANLIKKEEMRIECFGGKAGDNTFDNLTAYNRMIENHVSILLGAGVYYFSKIVLYNDEHMRGMGKNLTVLKPLASSESYFVTLNAGPIGYTHFADFQIEGSGNIGQGAMNLSGTAGTGSTGGLWNSVIDRIYIGGFTGHLLYVNASSANLPFQFNTFNNCTFSGDYNNIASENDLCKFDGGGAQLLFNNCEFRYFRNVSAISWTNGHATFIDCTIEYGTTGMICNDQCDITIIGLWAEGVDVLIKRDSLGSILGACKIVGGRINGVNGWTSNYLADIQAGRFVLDIDDLNIRAITYPTLINIPSYLASFWLNCNVIGQAPTEFMNRNYTTTTTVSGTLSPNSSAFINVSGTIDNIVLPTYYMKPNATIYASASGTLTISTSGNILNALSLSAGDIVAFKYLPELRKWTATKL